MSQLGTANRRHSALARPYEMPLLDSRERRHDTCRDGGRDDAERRNGKEDEECDETSYLVHDGVGHNQTPPHHEPAHHIRHLHDGNSHNPRPEPCGRSHSRQNLCEADDSKGEVRDAVELGESARKVGESAGGASRATLRIIRSALSAFARVSSCLIALASFACASPASSRIAPAPPATTANASHDKRKLSNPPL